MPDQDEWDEIERAKALRDPHAVRRERQHDPLRDEWLAILGDLPACRALWREQLEAIVDALLPSVRPRGKATDDEIELDRSFPGPLPGYDPFLGDPDAMFGGPV